MRPACLAIFFLDLELGEGFAPRDAWNLSSEGKGVGFLPAGQSSRIARAHLNGQTLSCSTQSVPPPPPQPPQAVSTQELPSCLACCEPPAVGRMADGAGTSAMRRRQRRLISWLRHERQTVAMELATALHHSRDARSEVAHEALRGQKTASSGTRPEPLVEVSEPQVGAVTVGYVAAPVPFLSSPVLADAAAEAVDARTVKYLLKAALRRREEEERKEWETELARREEQQRRVTESLEKARAALEPSRGSKRKRKKRRKRRLPRSSVPRGGRTSSTTAVACAWLVFLVFCRSPRHLRHHGRFGPD